MTRTKAIRKDRPLTVTKVCTLAKTGQLKEGDRIEVIADHSHGHPFRGSEIVYAIGKDRGTRFVDTMIVPNNGEDTVTDFRYDIDKDASYGGGRNDRGSQPYHNLLEVTANA